MIGREPDPGEVARHALLKVSAFDRLVAAMGQELGLEWTEATRPDRVVDMLLGQLQGRLMLADAQEKTRRQPWLKRHGW